MAAIVVYAILAVGVAFLKYLAHPTTILFDVSFFKQNWQAFKRRPLQVTFHLIRLLAQLLLLAVGGIAMGLLGQLQWDVNGTIEIYSHEFSILGLLLAGLSGYIKDNGFVFIERVVLKLILGESPESMTPKAKKKRRK